MPIFSSKGANKILGCQSIMPQKKERAILKHAPSIFQLFFHLNEILKDTNPKSFEVHSLLSLIVSLYPVRPLDSSSLLSSRTLSRTLSDDGKEK
ncbi:hypothetical protein CEXT_92561 [Caerostris extrusa]|uniref:Uncharacterized protein n=1 Tax=Caerostris extrusa TaxID=172846 RepID=A0AAV4NWS8_CAEEX|nr:hypothetical protein CEXT_92561 [Caerostris extrusa]